VRPVLMGRRGLWPLAGHLRGQNGHGTRSLAWAGRVAASADLRTAWAAAGAVHRALSQASEPDVGRRQSIVLAWERLDRIERAELGPLGGEDLHLLLVACDAEGIAVSAAGMGGLHALKDGMSTPWVEGRHPLLSRPGLPAERPGALTASGGPSWLVGVAWGESMPQGESYERSLARCGVDPGRPQ
jgi:hypothetical protein